MHLPTPTLVNPDLQRVGRRLWGELDDLLVESLRDGRGDALGDEARGKVWGEPGLRGSNEKFVWEAGCNNRTSS